jgi:hypothetical protein
MICLVTEKYERLMIMAWDSNVGLRSSETCLNQTSLGPTFVFVTDRCSDYAGYFIHWDFM